MKTKSIFIIVLIAAALICGCAKNELTLEDTVWKYGNDVNIYFYPDGKGMIDISGTEIEFAYEYADSLLAVTCTEKEFAESCGLDSLPFFATNAVAQKDGNLFVGSWELIKIE